MRTLANILVVLAALGLSIGLVIRLVIEKGSILSNPAESPIFFWRGSMGLLTLAIAIVLIQIRDK